MSYFVLLFYYFNVNLSRFISSVGEESVASLFCHRLLVSLFFLFEGAFGCYYEEK